MKFQSLAGALFALLLLTGCEHSNTSNPLLAGLTALPPDETVIRSGISFGECVGYCRREVQIDHTGAIYTESVWGRGSAATLPDRVFETSIPAAEWLDLLESVNMQTFALLDTVLGCPDCADGGAEWVEIQTASFRKKVTFEYNATIPGIENFVEKVRAMRARFDPQQAATPIYQNIIVTNAPLDAILKDTFDLLGATITGRALLLDIGHSGGCRDHYFSLFMAPAGFAKSNPPQAGLYLYHNANSDLCEAYLRRKIGFNLQPLIARYKSIFGSGAVLLNMHGFSGAAQDTVMQVRLEVK